MKITGHKANLLIIDDPSTGVTYDKLTKEQMKVWEKAIFAASYGGRAPQIIITKAKSIVYAHTTEMETSRRRPPKDDLFTPHVGFLRSWYRKNKDSSRFICLP
jgi:hypothetical protein